MNIGKIKALIDRQRSYISLANFAMIAFLFFDKIQWRWWYLTFIPLWILFAYIDAKYIMPKEFEYLHKKSPVIKKILMK